MYCAYAWNTQNKYSQKLIQHKHDYYFIYIFNNKNNRILLHLWMIAFSDCVKSDWKDKKTQGIKISSTPDRSPRVEGALCGFLSDRAYLSEPSLDLRLSVSSECRPPLSAPAEVDFLWTISEAWPGGSGTKSEGKKRHEKL